MIIFRILCFLWLMFINFSCNDSYNREVEIKEIIDSLNKDIYLFDSIYITTRGKERGTDKLLVVSYIFYIDDSSQIVLIPHNKKIDLEQFLSTNIIDRINEFADLRGWPKGKENERYVSWSKKISYILNKNKIIEVFNNPHLGDFTVFKFNGDIELVHLNDSSKVNSNYWSRYFKSSKPYSGKWYVRNYTN